MSRYEIVVHDKREGWHVKGGADSLVDAREMAVNILFIRNKVNDYAYIRVNGMNRYIIEVGPGGYKPGDALVHGYYPVIASIVGSQIVQKKGVNLDGTIMRRF